MIPDKEDYGSVYYRCVENKRPHAVRDRMKAVFPKFSDVYEDYIARAGNVQLHSFPVATEIAIAQNSVSSQEIHDLYDSAMVRKKGGGRADYDRIKASPRFGICPYCGQLPVKTLDHFLPRSKWKALSVCQVNLVPACRDCNTEKLEYSPSGAGDTLFHPYFDDMNAYEWLAAVVVEERPVRFEFGVACSFEDEIFSSRALSHFSKLNLKVLYETQAATEVSSLAAALLRIYSMSGYEGVRQELAVRARDNMGVSLNSWRSAMYRGASRSEWFCNMSWI